MKSIIVLFVVAISAICSVNATLKCDTPLPSVPEEWKDMSKGCIDSVKKQINTEVEASYAYLAMGAHFSQDTVNRPGFAEFFFHAATEEREHATKLIEYLLMRGETMLKISDLITNSGKEPKKTVWTSGAEALKDALNKETFVTKSIRKVIEACENDRGNNDYHLVDYLTGVYLEEQYNGQRDLAGKISTLAKMMSGPNAAIGEFLYDKKLLAQF